jgi:hypothetical protein
MGLDAPLDHHAAQGLRHHSRSDCCKLASEALSEAPSVPRHGRLALHRGHHPIRKSPIRRHASLGRNHLHLLRRRVGTYLRNFRKEDDANEFVRQLRDKRLHVHYKESNFDTSVILDRDLEMIVLLLPQLRSSKSQSSSRGTMPGAPEPVLSLSKDLAFERWDGNNLDQGSGSEAWSTTKLRAPSFASFLGEGWETTNPNPPVFLFPFHCYPPGAQQ